MKAKRTYKDSLFRDIFNDKKRLQSLYRALSGRMIPLQDIKRTTLRGTFFDDVKNDISFLAGNRHIVLMEHQSTLSDNMPLRMLWYVAKLYHRCVMPITPYREKRIPLPAPHFFVLYNGEKEMPEKWELRLSDAFDENSGALELTVTVFNINYAENREILERCHDLKCYSIFVAHVRESLANGLTLRQAIIVSVRYCKENDLLKDYFAQREQEEVLDMVNFKYDPELAMQARLEDAREDGMEMGVRQGMKQGVKQGIEQTLAKNLRNLVKNAKMTAKQAMAMLEIPVSEQPKYLKLLQE